MKYKPHFMDELCKNEGNSKRFTLFLLALHSCCNFTFDCLSELFPEVSHLCKKQKALTLKGSKVTDQELADNQRKINEALPIHPTILKTRSHSISGIQYSPSLSVASLSFTVSSLWPLWSLYLSPTSKCDITSFFRKLYLQFVFTCKSKLYWLQAPKKQQPVLA